MHKGENTQLDQILLKWSYSASAGIWCIFIILPSYFWGPTRICPIGSVLFLLYVNDITSTVQSQVCLFAGDCLIYRTINSKCDHRILQNDLDCLASWASKWQMEFNVAKCKILQVSKCLRSNFSYNMKGTPLEIVKEHNYLGITLHHRMSWKSHISNVCNKSEY